MTMKRILLLFLLFCGGYVHAQELDSVRIYYRQGHREVDVLFRDNRAELERFIRILREEYGANRLEGVVVRSWSSPEGVNHLNEVLSDRRADSLKTYLVRHAEIPDNLVCIHGEGIAWDMLRRMVAASDMLYKKRGIAHPRPYTGMGVRQGGSRSGRTKKAAHGPARRYAVHLHAGELLPRFTLQPFGGLLPETRTACKSHSPKRVGSERTGTGPATR